MRIEGIAAVLAFACAVSVPAPGLAQVVVRQQMVVPRDQPDTPATGTAIIKGRVVDAATGTPIVRARVRVQGRGVNTSPVLTDASGAFTVGGLPAGALMVVAEKSTYMPGRYPDTGRTMLSRARGAILRDGEVRDVVVRMYRSGVIAGRVLDAYGDPVEGAIVQAFRLEGGGRTSPRMRNGGNTNDLGEYRLTRLEPGRYLILAGTGDRFDGQGSANRTAPLPQALPTFYPASSSLDAAQPVEVERGETVAGIDVVLGEGMPAVVTGTVTTVDGRPLAGGSVVARARFERMEAFFRGGTGLRPDGTFRLSLTPGTYLLEARAASKADTSGRMTDEQYGTTQITVGEGPQEGVSIVIGSGATASGRVVFEGVTTLPPVPRGELRVPMMSAEDGLECRSGVLRVGPDWAFTVDGLIGTCTAPPGAMFGGFTVKAVMLNGENVLDRSVTFEPGQMLRDVQVVVTNQRTELQLHVADDSGQATTEYVALAFPADRSRWKYLERYVRVYVPPSPPVATAAVQASISQRPRRDVISSLMPGDYYVVALDDIGVDDARDPAVLEQLTSSAIRVTIAAGPNDVTLRRVRFGNGKW